MATVKKGFLTATKEWAVHLRPFGKRDFWKRERKAAQRDVEFIRSCGCVFCDVGLTPTADRRHWVGGEPIPCRREVP